MGLILVPLTLSTLYHFPSIISNLNANADSLIFLFFGAVLYVLFEVLFNRPMRAYVFGHELTHALASWIMGGSVHSFHVSKKGGNVTLSKTNFFVALAPYCIPIYTLFVLFVYFIVIFWYPTHLVQIIFLVSVGFTLAFHCSLTIFALQQEQPDIRGTGFLFSLVFILLVNSWFLVLLSKTLFWNMISLKGFFVKTVKTQFEIWKWIYMEGITLVKYMVQKT